MKTNSDYFIQHFPLSRLLTMDIGKIGMKKHHIKALIEVDVTAAREKIALINSNSQKSISFTAWILKCIAQSISEHKQVQAFKGGKTGLILFDDVDISIVVERIVQGSRVPLPAVIRKANHKSSAQLFTEIESLKYQDISKGNEVVLGKDKPPRAIGLFLHLPQWIRLFIWNILLSNPLFVRKMMGTSMVTSVGMMGNARGWFIPFTIHPVCFALSAIVKRSEFENGAIALREYLPLTILIDHDVIDGAPAARFISRLTEIIESAYDL